MAAAKVLGEDSMAGGAGKAAGASNTQSGNGLDEDDTE